MIAPHPDDEVLGVGGTMARLADNGAEVTVAVVTKAYPPLFSEAISIEGRREAKVAHDMLSVAHTRYLDQPAAEIDDVAHHELNRVLLELVRDCRPDLVFLPFMGDLHLDHQLILTSSLVATRPSQDDYPPIILSYETVSETNWNAPGQTPSFTPNIFIDIGATLERKLKAMEAFGSQSRAFPHERSTRSLEALATLRGCTVHRPAAEAFVAVRAVL